jgi:hypothetical protein
MLECKSGCETTLRAERNIQATTGAVAGEYVLLAHSRLDGTGDEPITCSAGSLVFMPMIVDSGYYEIHRPKDAERYMGGFREPPHRSCCLP